MFLAEMRKRNKSETKFTKIPDCKHQITFVNVKSIGNLQMLSLGERF